MAEDTTSTIKYSLWDFKKYKEYEWFRFLILLLFVITLLYLLSHFIVGETARYEYETLDKEQIEQISRIYLDTPTLEKEDSSPVDTGDSLSIEPDESGQPITTNRLEDNTEDIRKDTSKCTRAILYIENHFNQKVDSVQIEKFRPYLCSASSLEAISFLGNVRLRVKSYFWLTGPEVYFEIIFWAWFGVIASLLFNLGVVGRNRTTDATNQQSVFDSSEIPYQIAKLLYAPLCTLIIVLGYNYFSDQSIVDISSSKGVLVFSFVGGFYSARLVSFLDRLKEVLLPHSGTAELPAQKPTTAATLQNIVIELELDDATIPSELKSSIAEIGLGEATVTLQNDENGQIATAVRKGEDQSSTFAVAEIQPGKYIIKATWSKEVNGEPVNLEAEKTEDIKNADTTIPVVMKKAESEG